MSGQLHGFFQSCQPDSRPTEEIDFGWLRARAAGGRMGTSVRDAMTFKLFMTAGAVNMGVWEWGCRCFLFLWVYLNRGSCMKALKLSQEYCHVLVSVGWKQWHYRSMIHLTGYYALTKTLRMECLINEAVFALREGIPPTFFFAFDLWFVVGTSPPLVVLPYSFQVYS